jgi:multidrug resistance efflux pump
MDAIVRRIRMLNNELEWIDEEILKISAKQNQMPEDRSSFFGSSEDIARLQFLLSRNAIVRQRLEEVRNKIKSASSTVECER